MITSTKQYDSTIELFRLLYLLSVKKAMEANDSCEDSYGPEYTECGDCGNMNCDCDCGDYNEDGEYDGGCRCNNEDGSCTC